MWSERLTPNVSQNIQLTLWMDLRSVRGSQQGLDAPEPLLRGLHPVRLRATWKTLCLDRCSGPNSPAFRRLNGTEVPLLGSWLTEEWQRWGRRDPNSCRRVLRLPGAWHSLLSFCRRSGLGPDHSRQTPFHDRSVHQALSSLTIGSRRTDGGLPPATQYLSSATVPSRYHHWSTPRPIYVYLPLQSE